jgi:hypothetical protein
VTEQQDLPSLVEEEDFASATTSEKYLKIRASIFSLGQRLPKKKESI